MRKITVAAVLLLAFAAVAGAQHMRAVAPPQMPIDPDMLMMGNNAGAVSGTVTSVSGNTISLANGLVTIDATNAKIIGDHGAQATIAAVTPGSLVMAVLSNTTSAANAPLAATLVAVMHQSQVTLTGIVTAVDSAHSTLTLLGRTIQVNAQTSFDAPFHGSTIKGIADVQPNEIVTVDANASNATLVATTVHVNATVHISLVMLHGTVKSIAADSWVIAGRDKDFTAKIDAQTKIVGDPKTGDTVDALLREETNGSYTAITIAKSLMSMLPH